MTYGINSSGFNRKTSDVLTSEIQQAFKDKFGLVNFNDKGYIAVITGIMIVSFALLWETLELIYHQLNKDSAEGVNLDNTNALVNVPRITPEKSKVVLTLTNNTGSPVTVPAGNIVSQSANNVLWETLSEVIIPPNDTITVNAETQEYGAYTASIGTIDTRVTPISGWSAVTNLVVATVGKFEETDVEYRLRTEYELATSQGGLLSSVINRIRTEVDGVTYISGHENFTDEIVVKDGNDILPHSIALTIVGGDEQELANKIYELKGNGINTSGSDEFTVIDGTGHEAIIRYSRADIVDIFVTYTITVTDEYDVSFNETIKDYVEEFNTQLNEGKNILKWQLISLVPFGIQSGALPTNNNDSLVDVSVKFGKTINPTTETPIEILHNKKARILRSNIVINMVNV